MKKLTKLLSGLACLALATSLIACKTPEDPTGGEAPGGNKNPSNVDKPSEEKSSIWDGAEVVESLAGQKTSWGDAIKMPNAYTKRIQVGSKVIFELEPIEDAEGNSYLKFHIDNGNWGACGVEEYFAADGSKLNVTEDENNDGVFNSDSYEKAVVAYFVVTEENINKLQAGFAFNGNLQVKKVAITNLAPVDPNAAGYTVSNCKAYAVKFTSSTSDDEENPVKLGYLLQIDNDGEKDETGLKIVVSDLILSVKVGDDEAKEINMGEMILAPDQYSSPAYSKSGCRKVIEDNGVPVSVTSGTQVTVQVVSATIDNEDKAGSIVFAFQKEGGDYQFFADDKEMWQPAFAANED